MNRITETSHQPPREEVHSSLSNLHFFIPGYQICERISSCRELTSCFKHRGFGNLISTKSDNKVYILTVNHLFKPLLEQYALIRETKALYFFRHKKEEINDGLPLTSIHVGTYDPEADKIMLKGDKTPQGEVHLHT